MLACSRTRIGAVFGGAISQGEGAELSISVSAASFLPGEELTISYTLPHDADELRVYDAMGELYRELIPETATAAGTGSVIWDGSDASGAQFRGTTCSRCHWTITARTLP